MIRYVADFKPVFVFAALRENMTLCKTAEIHNVLHCHQRTEPQPQITCTENFVNCGHMVFEICERTDSTGR